MENAQRTLKKTGEQFKAVGAGLSLGVTAPILGLGAAAINVAADFEVLETSLVTAFNGSEAAAKDALKSIIDFSAKTPFQVDEVASAFIKLKNLGLDPSEASLTSFGNTAAATGKSLDQVIEAVADAATGEFERLKEFGIKSKSEGDKVTFTFKGIATTVKKDSASIQKYLLNIGDTDFAGGMERQSKTFKGQLSTLKDALAQTGVEFGKIILEYIKPFVARIGELANSFKNLSPETKKIIVIFGAFAASLGPILVAVGYLATNVVPGLLIVFAKLRAAFVALSAVISANPFTAAAIALGALIAVIYAYTRAGSQASQVAKTLADVQAQSAASTAKERAELDSLLKIAKDETQLKENRISAIKKLNALSPEYLGNITLETINTSEATKATENYITALNRKAQTQAAISKKQELFTKKLEKETEALRPNGKVTGFVQDLSDGFFSLLGVETDVIAGVKDLNKRLQEGVATGKITQQQADLMRKTYAPYVAEREKELKVIDAQINALDQYITSTDGYTSSVVAATTATTDYNKAISAGSRKKLEPLKIDTSGGSGIDVSNEKLREQIAVLESARIQYSATSAEYKYLSDQIAFHSTTIANSIKGIVAEAATLPLQMAPIVEQTNLVWQSLKDNAEVVGDAIGGAFEGFTGRLVDSLNLADDGFQGFAKSLAGTVTKLISIFLGEAIASAIAGATESGTATGPGAVFTTPAFIATAVGGVLAAFAAIPKFADGGIAYGPTLGLMGEYAGARNNPEVIAPLNKLKDLINPSGSGVELSLGSIIRGSDLQIVINRAIDKKLRLG